MFRDKEPSNLNRLVSALENAGDKDMPPVRALAVAVTAAIAIIEKDSEKSDILKK